MTLLGSDPWPMDLEINGSVAGKIDGLSSPAPSGGPPRPSNGLDAVAVLGGDLLETDMVRVALKRGGHLRVGLEDYARPGQPTNL